MIQSWKIILYFHYRQFLFEEQLLYISIVWHTMSGQWSDEGKLELTDWRTAAWFKDRVRKTVVSGKSWVDISVFPLSRLSSVNSPLICSGCFKLWKENLWTWPHRPPNKDCLSVSRLNIVKYSISFYTTVTKVQITCRVTAKHDGNETLGTHSKESDCSFLRFWIYKKIK